MTKISFITLQGQCSCHTLGIATLHQNHKELPYSKCPHTNEEPLVPISILTRKNLIKKNTGKKRTDERYEGCHQRKDKRQPKSFTRTFEVFPHIGTDIGLMTTLLKLLSRFEREAYTRKLPAKLVHRPFRRTCAGIIQTGTALAIEATKHNEMIKVPMDNSRLLAFQGFGRHTKTLCLETIASGSMKYALRTRTVTRHATCGTHLLQRKPFAIVSQNHCKRCSSTLHGFHLHHLRNLC